MGGSSGRLSYRNDSSSLKDIENRKSETDYASEVSQIIKDVLKIFNDRDTESINKHIEEVEKILSKDIEEFVDMRFGGSVSKHSYVDGLSDIDILVNVANTEYANKTPQELISDFTKLIKQRFPNTEVTQGKMAVTIKYSDGCELQLLPTLKTTTGIRIANAEGNGWSNVVKPQKFAEKLTEINNKCSGRVVPVIKLFKGMQSSLPQDIQLSGYHIESLAVNAFKSYSDNLNPKDMLKHLCRYVANNVKNPVADSTGQSVHVDDKLGKSNSESRQKISHQFERLSNKLDSADNKKDSSIWDNLLNG
ncbi:MAG: CBASS oligonucleotide cyclase [Methylococcaceae bacterium]